MRHYKYSDNQKYDILLLVQSLNIKEIEKAYLQNLDKSKILIVDLYKDPIKKKTPVSDMKEYLNEEISPILSDYSVKYVICADADYFKILAKVTKTEPYLGYILDSPLYPVKVLYVPSYKQMFYDPEKIGSKINIALKSLNDALMGAYSEPGNGIIKSQFYPKSLEQIRLWLERFIKEDRPLTCDIETYSLKHTKAKIATITFCWNEHEGIAFNVAHHNTERMKQCIYTLLYNFFCKFKNKLIFHNIAFDATVIIYELFMKSKEDNIKGMLEGLEVVLKNFEDTKLITYLATNSCSGNTLGLKANAQEFAGNYALEEIGDINKINEHDVLRYNLIDGLSTWFVYNKYYQKMIDDEQLDIYEKLFKPATVDIINMQLIGMPIDLTMVEKAKDALNEDLSKSLDIILNNQYVDELEVILDKEWVDKRNSKLKTKKVTIDDAAEKFNPNSGPQLKKLFYEVMKLPVINLTETKQPATDSDTCKDLINHTDDPEIKKILQAFIDYSAANKILTAFIPVFEQAKSGKLYGNFNLGGTVSGRLSSSKPNLQQIPATGSKYAKLIKSCFKAPDGWLFCGLDYSSLEDRISALTTKDPNKLGVYIHHYDGHCLRAYSYFKDKMPDITEKLKGLEPDSKEYVEVINSIKSSHKDLRQLSKSPTFALTYAGTWRTLVQKCGFSEETAKQIEAAYHDLYKISDEWVKNHIQEASIKGYATCAFGLRVRTPMLYQTLRGMSKTPFEAEAEARTAGNALGQSWCLLTNRAGIEFNSKIRESKYKYDILPVAQIHDAQYFLIRDNPEIIAWANEHLVKAVQWQDNPVIAHDKVKLTGELSIFYPDWAHELVVPNQCSEPELIKLVRQYMENLSNGK